MYGEATPPDGNDFVAIAACLYHSLALKSDGSIAGWGWNEDGQVTPPDGNDFVAIIEAATQQTDFVVVSIFVNLLLILITQNGCTKKEPPSAGNETTNEISSESHQPEQGKVITNSIGMKLVYIPAGSFMMGSPSNEEGRRITESPQHQVHISGHRQPD